MPELPSPLRVAVIGGGISGLSAAHRLIELSAESGRAIDVTLFEAADRLGGIIRTTHVEGCIVEEGPDSFITNKPWAIDLCRRLGLKDRLISTDGRYRKSLILHRGQPVETPEGFNLLAPAKVWPFLKTPLLSWGGKLRMLREYFVSPRKDGVEESLEQFVVRRFGREALQRIVQPMVGGIYTSDPAKLSLQATLPRFIEMEGQYGSVIRGLRSAGRPHEGESHASGARYGLFVSLKDGMEELIHRLQQSIAASGRIELQAPVDEVRAVADGSQGVVLHREGREESFDRVILALPAHRTASLLRGASSQAGNTPSTIELADALDAIPYASSAILVSVHHVADIRHPLDAFGLVIPHIEGRRILAVSFLHRKFIGRAPETMAILRTFVGGELQPELLDQDDQQLQQMVLEELRDVLGVIEPPSFAKLARYRNAMPQYHVGHANRIARIAAEADKLPWLQLAGNYTAGVGIPDAIHSGEQAAEALM